MNIIDQARVEFNKARAFQGRVRSRIRVETGMADWNVLRSWSKQIHRDCKKCSPDRFRSLVMRHDPQLALEVLENAWIVGGGSGGSNLNAYRCGVLNGDIVFEKIYLRDSGAWRRNKWFHANIAPRLEERVRTPRLIHQVQGSRLAAVYFEYMPDMTSVSVDACFHALPRFHTQVVDLDITKEPSWVADIRLADGYAKGAACLRQILATARRDPSEIDAVEKSLLANDTRKILAHGDLKPENMSPDGTIVDWDNCGVFPIGYDYGHTIGLLKGCNSLHDFETLIRGDIARTCADAPGSLHFFTAINYARKYLEPWRKFHVSDDLILALFDRARAL